MKSAEQKIHILYTALMEQMQELLEWSEQPDDYLLLKDEKKSGWGVWQHLGHLALADGSTVKFILDALMQTQPNAKDKPNWLGRFILGTGLMFRGVSKAPKELVFNEASLQKLRRNVARARRLLKGLEGDLLKMAQCEGRSRHPRLEMLRPEEWIRFMLTHNRHHMRIVRDIVKTGKPVPLALLAPVATKEGSSILV